MLKILKYFLNTRYFAVIALIGRVMKVKYSILGAASFAILIAPPGWARCNLTDRIYRDVGNRGFELEFSPPSIPRPDNRNFARATIRYADGSVLYTFRMASSLGYSRTSLINEDGAQGFTVNFFNTDLTPTSCRDSEDPAFLFISDLGIDEFYQGRVRRYNTNAPILSDVMWQFDRCKT